MLISIWGNSKFKKRKELMNYGYSQESVLILKYYVPLKEIFHPKVR